MSLLPQRKKTPEELAKLREELGILELSETPESSVPDAVVVPDAAIAPEAVVAPEAETDSVAPASEIPTELEVAPQAPQSPPVAAEPAGPKRKQVWSLRRSEWAEPSEPITRSHPQTESSALPSRRRSERELMELRRVTIADPEVPVSYLKSLTAHPVWIVLGYLLPFAGGMASLIVPLFLVSFPFNPLYAYLGGALGIAFGLYVFTKVRSRHHGGFISALAVLVLIFTVLQHLEPFQHAA